MSFRPGFSFRIALLYLLLIGGLFWFILHKALDTLDASVRQAAEDVMVDAANLLAEQISQQLDQGVIDIDKLRGLVSAYLERPLSAQIYSVLKTKPDMQVYVTDARGTVLYDSTGQHEGSDFSAWRDVWLTLRGRYGARSSALDITTKVSTPEDRAMYVAAAIYHGDEVLGVVTVSKEVRHLDPFVLSSSSQLQAYAAVVLLISLLFGAGFAWWLSRSVRKLVSYADDLAAGRKVAAPKLQEHEFDKLSRAMEDMQEEIEGRRYVEEYIHTMAHELKSPISGIQATVELLQDVTMDERQRERFISNINESAERMTRLVERLLQLAKLEQRRYLEQIETIDVERLLDEIISERSGVLSARDIRFIRQECDGVLFRGEQLLIRQAISNLVDNALDFSPTGGKIMLSVGQHNGTCRFSIRDQGPGIPDYAREKIYQRFYSLPRPGNQKRSSGIGLSFVREVMNLHHGQVRLSNHEEGGVSAVLSWSCKDLHINDTNASQ